VQGARSSEMVEAAEGQGAVRLEFVDAFGQRCDSRERVYAGRSRPNSRT
jgi:hypothetical protein